MLISIWAAIFLEGSQQKIRLRSSNILPQIKTCYVANIYLMFEISMKKNDFYVRFLLQVLLIIPSQTDDPEAPLQD